MNEAGRNMLGIAAGVAALFVVGVGGVVGSCAAYNSVRVWNAETKGRAQLAQAQQNRQIGVLNARAKKDAAVLLAEAEVARARGVAEANQIVAKNLGGPEGYLRYLYIQTLEGSRNQVIYVPTEGGLPILEAGRLNRQETN